MIRSHLWSNSLLDIREEDCYFSAYVSIFVDRTCRNLPTSRKTSQCQKHDPRLSLSRLSLIKTK